MAFDSQTEAKQFASLVAQNTKTPEGVPVFWATTGNRTQIPGTTNRSNSRYTIIAIFNGSLWGRAKPAPTENHSATFIPIFKQKVEGLTCS